MFLLWKLFKLTLTCNSDYGGGVGNDDTSDTGHSFGGSDTDTSAETDVAMSNNPAHLGMAEAGLNQSMYGGLNEAVQSGNFDGLDFSIGYDTVVSEFNFSSTHFTVNNVTGWFDAKFDNMFSRHYGANTATVIGGTIASHLFGFGMSAEKAIVAEVVAKTALGLLFGAGILSTVLSLSKAVVQSLGITGVLTEKQYEKASMAVGIVSAMTSTMHTLQALSSISSNFGYMSTEQKITALAVTGLSIKNNINSFKAINEKYNIETSEVNIADIGDIEFNESDSLLTNYEKVIKYTKDKKLQYATKPNEWRIVDKMAGSIMFDAFMAGSDFFNVTTEPTQIMASVGSKYNISNFARQSFLQEDYLSSLDVFNKINKIYESDARFSLSVENMI